MTTSAAASRIARHGGIAPSRWNRTTNDAYFTIDAPWIIPALLSKVKIEGPVLEPAAGVGHLVREPRCGYGLEVIAGDLHAYEEPLVPDIGFQDIWEIRSLQAFLVLLHHELALSRARRACRASRCDWHSRRLQHRSPNPRRMDRGRQAPQPCARTPAFCRRRSSGIAATLVGAQHCPRRHNFIWAIWNAASRSTACCCGFNSPIGSLRPEPARGERHDD